MYGIEKNEKTKKDANVRNVYLIIAMDTVRLIDRTAAHVGISRSAFIRGTSLMDARRIAKINEIDMQNDSRDAAKLTLKPVTSQHKESKPDADRTK